MKTYANNFNNLDCIDFEILAFEVKKSLFASYYTRLVHFESFWLNFLHYRNQRLLRLCWGIVSRIYEYKLKKNLIFILYKLFQQNRYKMKEKTQLLNVLTSRIETCQSSQSECSSKQSKPFNFILFCKNYENQLHKQTLYVDILRRFFEF